MFFFPAGWSKVVYIYIFFFLQIYTYVYMFSIWICDLFGFHFQIARNPDLQATDAPIGTKWSAGALGRTCRHGARAAASRGWGKWLKNMIRLWKKPWKYTPNRWRIQKSFVSVIGMHEENEVWKLVLTSITPGSLSKMTKILILEIWGPIRAHPSHKTSLILCLFSGVLSLCFGCGKLFAATVIWFERLVQQDKLRLQNYGRKYSEAGQPGQVNVGEETVPISPAQRAQASAFIILSIESVFFSI